ncbi:MAG: GntR family transcriptional regulator [Ruminococcaceae bacterium]|nr:GntR family transcriptional regulator [Oscillospiraceae bacterium]
MAWSFSAGTAVYIQIARKIRRFVISGKYLPGEKIPTVRQMATDAAVNPNTVQRAFSLLESEGLIESRGTLGRFVTSDPEKVKRAREIEAASIALEFVREADELKISKAEIIKLIEEARNEHS